VKASSSSSWRRAMETKANHLSKHTEGNLNLTYCSLTFRWRIVAVHL
jgi:hypothetical protein